jgi:ubiquitin C-terminal hydrolase
MYIKRNKNKLNTSSVFFVKKKGKKMNINTSNNNGMGLSGLANVGNTCYLNSCMQILSHTKELSAVLADGTYKQKLNRTADSLVLLEWDKLREMLWSKNCSVAPWGYVKTVQKVAGLKHRDLFTGSDQNDLSEFLLFIVECFHGALSREVEMRISGTEVNGTDKLAKACYDMMKNMYAKEYSEMLNIFYGIHMSDITAITEASSTVSLSMTAEPFSILTLPLPSTGNECSLYDCLDLYCQKEILQGENAWLNPQTQERIPVHRNIIFWSLPNILVIVLKRFNFQSAKNSRKIQSLVTAPLLNADFSKYVKGYNAASYIYDLYGVCNHSGGNNGGHYTAYIKSNNEKWYMFNDTNVSEIKEAQVITTQAYCLFYRKL